MMRTRRTPTMFVTFGSVFPLVAGVVRATAPSAVVDTVSDDSPGVVLILDVGDRGDLGVLVVSGADAGVDGNGCSVVLSS